MIVLLHVAIALTSIGYTSYMYMYPSTVKFRVAYGLVGATLVSGSYLVWTMPSHMIEACTMGLFYLGLVAVGTVVARVKYARLYEK